MLSIKGTQTSFFAKCGHCDNFIQTEKIEIFAFFGQ